MCFRGFMTNAWNKRWSIDARYEVEAAPPSLIVQPLGSIEQINWSLPPSKSHAIRWLALAAQSEQDIVFDGMKYAGQDIISMRRCLRQMGVPIIDLDDGGNPVGEHPATDDQPSLHTSKWLVRGVGKNGLVAPEEVIDAGNSGTALRILMAICARFTTAVVVDGDATLRARDHGEMIDGLHQLGVSTVALSEDQHLPLSIKGPWVLPEELHVDVSKSSQPTTAWCLAAPALNGRLLLRSEGAGVSLRHSELTKSLCVNTGAPDGFLLGQLEAWTPTVPNATVVLPPDASMLAFACLAASVCGVTVRLDKIPEKEESIGHEVLTDAVQKLGLVLDQTTVSTTSFSAIAEVDLRHANDLITPLAAMMAIAKGGTISGVAHAAFKETDRTTGTVNLLRQFGLRASFQSGHLVVEGEQKIQQPTGLVETYGDHRMQMTALVLAMGCSEPVRIEGGHLHEVADPQALERWEALGVAIERVVNP